MSTLGHELAQLGMDIIEPKERIGGAPTTAARRWVPDSSAPQARVQPIAECVVEPETPAPGTLAHIALRDAALRGLGVETEPVA